LLVVTQVVVGFTFSEFMERGPARTPGTRRSAPRSWCLRCSGLRFAC
jgi:hypothetical protein